MYRRFDACSYACAIKQRAKRDTALWHQDRYSVVNNACPSCYSVGEKKNCVEMGEAYSSLKAFESSSKVGELRWSNEDHIQLLYNDTCELQILRTMSLVYREWQATPYLTSSFSIISANVRYIFSVFMCTQSCRTMRLPLVSNSLLSVLNSSKRLCINALK